MMILELHEEVEVRLCNEAKTHGQRTAHMVTSAVRRWTVIEPRDIVQQGPEHRNSLQLSGGCPQPECEQLHCVLRSEDSRVGRG